MQYTIARTLNVDMQTAQIIWIGSLILLALMIIAWAKIFHKAGERWWKILIPIYGSYCQYKIADSQGLFWGTLVVSTCSSVITRLVAGSIARNTYVFERPNTTAVTVIAIIAGIIVLIMSCVFEVRLAHVFGKGNGFAVGLILLNPIFVLILAFGSAEYVYYSGSSSAQAQIETWKCSVCGAENPASRASCQSCGRVR